MVYCTMSTNLTKYCCHKNQIKNCVDIDLILSRKKKVYFNTCLHQIYIENRK